eukprot:GHRR01027688.1.p1 GENE.GHRR01027688.1~~GHRR01027688.1.p1  ORF type:complete len:187 (+),score=54.13 GHRR01027688.1:631-1191(+)
MQQLFVSEGFVYQHGMLCVCISVQQQYRQQCRQHLCKPAGLSAQSPASQLSSWSKGPAAHLCRTPMLVVLPCRVPLEVKVMGDKDPVYNFTLEDLGRYNEQPVLPFNAYGTLAWARAEFDNDSASSQIFFLLKESELTPSGANLLDGRYAVFGYAISGQDNLGLMKVGDKINYIKVVDGAENLVNA